jgi:competence protein CoiA
MKFALVGGEKSEATKGLKGFCPSCGSELVAKCGETKVNHWAHKGNRNCDPWWENETDWHRSWKNNFPKEWQERIHIDEKSGEKHIADVKTDSGWVLEFQHSHINSEERRSRNSFYPKLVWVIDGVRRQRDKPNYYRILEENSIRSDVPRLKRIICPDECRLIKEWHESDLFVFFDFQDVDKDKQPIIWFLFPRTTNKEAFLCPMTRAEFIELHYDNKFDELVENIILPFIAKLKNIEKSKVTMGESLPRMNLPTYRKRRFRL